MRFILFMKKGKKIERPEKEKRAERIYSRIIKGLVIADVALLLVNWVYSLCVAGFILWSAYFYERGCMEWVCDEYEQDGYPQQGLYRMFRSWVTFAVLLVVILVIIYRNYSS